MNHMLTFNVFCGNLFVILDLIYSIIKSRIAKMHFRISSSKFQRNKLMNFETA